MRFQTDTYVVLLVTQHDPFLAINDNSVVAWFHEYRKAKQFMDQLREHGLRGRVRKARVVITVGEK
jgi:hypothetical protein